ncbi:50S ribosomal protein L6 [Flavobacteriaceae bacterium]|nr:50S ribosomal protein L6 [Flavobacteriaceae bacterium]
MSRVGKLPIKVPESIKLDLVGDRITMELKDLKEVYNLMPSVKADYKSGVLSFFSKEDMKVSRDLGLDRSRVNNIILGLQTPFNTKLEVNGVGYKFVIKNSLIIFSLGYSHDIAYCLPKMVTATFEKPNILSLSSHNKVLLGRVCSEIISFRKPEPYKGKGIKKLGSYIIRKEGKKK